MAWVVLLLVAFAFFVAMLGAPFYAIFAVLAVALLAAVIRQLLA